MKRFVITTLGCKVNQCESSALGSLLEGAGYRHDTSGKDPDLVVVNTCTVTGKAAMQSRQEIRKAVRNHPNAKIVVTGCYAQTAPQEIQAIQGVEYIVGHADKMNIARLIAQTSPASIRPALVLQNIQHDRCFDPLPSVAPESRTRAFLKIQDGCNAFCTYCIVPHARGRSRSMPVEDVLRHIQNLAQRQYKEIVLTGIHLGAFGKDQQPAASLYDLLRLIGKQPMAPRLRLSSIEPTEVEPQLLELMSGQNLFVCPHLHIPLQSGDNAILRRMGRPYTREQFAETVLQIRKALPHAAIGVDVLVGFPGEEDSAFDNTFALIQDLDITYLHVFPFSPRKGTPAAAFKGKVQDHIVKERCKRLRQLGEEKKATFYRANINRRVNVLIEKHDRQTGLSSGLSENYIPVVLPGANAEENTIARARIRSVDPDLKVMGTIEG